MLAIPSQMRNLVIPIEFPYFSICPLCKFFTQQPVSLWKPKSLLYSHLKMASHFQKNTQILRCSLRPHMIQYFLITWAHTHILLFLTSDSLAHSLLATLVSLLFLERAKNTPIQGISPLPEQFFTWRVLWLIFTFFIYLLKDTFPKSSFTLCTKPLLLGFVFPKKIYYT